MDEPEYENTTLTYMLGTADGQKTPNTDCMELTSTQQLPNDYMQRQNTQLKSATDYKDAEQCRSEQKLGDKKYPQHRISLKNLIIAVMIFMVVVLLVSLTALALAVFSFPITERSLNEIGSQLNKLKSENDKSTNDKKSLNQCAHSAEE